MDIFGLCCSSRAAPPASSNPVGVGIVFQPDPTGALFVKSLSLDGPAYRSQLVEIGDCLHEINSINVYRKPVSMVAPLMLGPAGSTVRLGFERGGSAQVLHVELTRGASSVPPGSLTSQQYAHHLSTNLKSVPDSVQRTSPIVTSTSVSSTSSSPANIHSNNNSSSTTNSHMYGPSQKDITPMAAEVARNSNPGVRVGSDFPRFSETYVSQPNSV